MSAPELSEAPEAPVTLEETETVPATVPAEQQVGEQEPAAEAVSAGAVPEIVEDTPPLVVEEVKGKPTLLDRLKNLSPFKVSKSPKKEKKEEVPVKEAPTAAVADIPTGAVVDNPTGAGTDVPEVTELNPAAAAVTDVVEVVMPQAKTSRVVRRLSARVADLFQKPRKVDAPPSTKVDEEPPVIGPVGKVGPLESEATDATVAADATPTIVATA